MESLYVTFCVWFLLLGVMFSKFIHLVVRIGGASFLLWPNNIPLYGCTSLVGPFIG